MDRIIIHKDTYYDSVFLTAVLTELKKKANLIAGHILLATEANVKLLAKEAFHADELSSLKSTDLIVALRSDDPQILHQTEIFVNELLSTGRSPKHGAPIIRPIGLRGGLASLPDANLALISVPGEYAAFEASKALEQGLHVMLFSNNVSLEDEVLLKQQASEKGLLVMGPDCGTALISGQPLGFANRLRAGSIGLVGASGTGLQEISCQIHRLGSGVSQIIGTGGRDLKEQVEARTTIAALSMFAEDPKTNVLVVVSNPPSAKVADRVFEKVLQLDLPAVICFLGDEKRKPQDNVHLAPTLSEAAWLAHCLSTGQSIATTQPFYTVWQDVHKWIDPMAPEQRYLQGLFSGGTLASEALQLMRRDLKVVFSNLDHPEGPIPDQGHILLDLGDDRFTRGKPHPMIDPTFRCEQIVHYGSQPSTAVLLLDLVLGSACHPDPAAVTAAAIIAAKEKNPALAVVSSITGTDLDHQGLSRQQKKLSEIGVQVLSSNLAACTLAVRITSELEER